MERENKSFKEVLQNAKELGYAESNPTSDLDGEDVASKLKILSSLCFSSFLNKNIHVEGIKDIDKDDINYAKRLGYKIKLLGYAELIGKKIYHRVHPTLIKDSSFIIANDTGPAHIAAHVGAKGLTLFGKHTTAYKVSIERENFKVIEVTDLNKLSAEKVFERLINNLTQFFILIHKYEK